LAKLLEVGEKMEDRQSNCYWAIVDVEVSMSDHETLIARVPQLMSSTQRASDAYDIPVDAVV
jgi:hypothetical protein